VEFENSVLFSPTFKPPAHMSSLMHFGVTDGVALLIKAVVPSSSSSTSNFISNSSAISNIHSSANSNSGFRFVNSIYEIPLDARPKDLLSFCEVQ
jgi:hypothetical protein